MGITLKEGRLIAESDINGADPIVLVNETAARTLWHGASPIGARARIGDNTGPFHTVVGVVNDVHHFDLSEPPTTQMYFPQRQRTDSFLVLVVRTTTDPAAFAAPIRVLVASLAKDVPVFDVATLDERVSRSVASRTFLMQLLGLFAAATVLLSVVGLYAVVSHSVATRRREFGVRLALGAARQDIWWLVLRRGFTLVFCGLAAGLGGSFLLGRLLASQLFQTPSVDPVTLVGSAAVLLGVSLVAHFGPIRRALRVDPALALRSE
jgi:putative ABC transport system permease protein